MPTMGGSRMTWRLVRHVTLAVALALGARTLPAQGNVERACLTTLLDAAVPDDAYWRARHPALLTASLAPVEQDGGWSASLETIQELFRQDAQHFPDGAPLAPVYGRVREELERFAAGLSDALDADGSEGVDGATRFNVVQDPATGGFLILDQSDRIPLDASPEQARSLCWLGHSLTRFHSRLTRIARHSTERALRARVQRWNAFTERGLTPFPWELALNEAVHWLGSRDPLEPPRLQLIALRPSAAIETDSRLEQRVNLLAVEALGVVVYPSSRDWHLSLAATWVSPSESTAGVGVMMRVAPWLVSAGLAWRDVDGDGDRERRLILSLDAYDLLRGAPAQLREAASRATGGRTDR